MSFIWHLVMMTVYGEGYEQKQTNTSSQRITALDEVLTNERD